MFDLITFDHISIITNSFMFLIQIVFSAMTLTTIGFDKDPKSVSEIGSMLFKRGVSGARVVTGKETKVIEGHTFKGSGLDFKVKNLK